MNNLKYTIELETIYHPGRYLESFMSAHAFVGIVNRFLDALPLFLGEPFWSVGRIPFVVTAVFHVLDGCPIDHHHHAHEISNQESAYKNL